MISYEGENIDDVYPKIITAYSTSVKRNSSFDNDFVMNTIIRKCCLILLVITINLRKYALEEKGLGKI